MRKQRKENVPDPDRRLRTGDLNVATQAAMQKQRIIDGPANASAPTAAGQPYGLLLLLTKPS